MKRTGHHIWILRQLDLNETERSLLDINLKLLASRYRVVRECAMEGVDSLIAQVHFRMFLLSFKTTVLVWP